MAPQVVLCSSDLMSLSPIAAAVKQRGGKLLSCPTATAALAACAQPTALLIIDLGTLANEAATFIRQAAALPQPPAAILAYGSHVKEQLLSDAQAAGCQAVLSRGQFFGQLEAILRRWLPV